MTTLPTPNFREQVRQVFQIEPLGGPTTPQSYLDRFPDEVYDKTIDSHLVRFMYSLLGPAGVGWLRKNYLDARLTLYAHGFDTFAIETFYGNPLRFGRILSEQFSEDPIGLLTRAQWDEIKVKDESYRSRAIAFFQAARLGNTPEGMELAAQSGLGHAAEVIENYKYVFDSHADEPLGLPRFGQTLSTSEFIVVPRQEVSRTEAQVISFEDPDVITAGQYVLEFRGQFTAAIAWNASSLDLQTALRGLSTIGTGSLRVTGGPIPNPFIVTFTGALSNQNVPLITAISSLTDDDDKPHDTFITTQTAGLEAFDEIVHIPDEAQHNLQVSLDYLRPVGTLPTVYDGHGTRSTAIWRNVHATSRYVEVIRFVTGTNTIQWPDTDGANWVEEGVENESRRVPGDLQYHHAAFVNPSGVRAYTDDALDDPQYGEDVAVVANYPTTHVGRFLAEEVAAFPFLAAYTSNENIFKPEYALHEVTHLPLVTTQEDLSGTSLIDGTINANTLGNWKWSQGQGQGVV